MNLEHDWQPRFVLGRRGWISTAPLHILRVIWLHGTRTSSIFLHFTSCSSLTPQYIYLKIYYSAYLLYTNATVINLNYTYFTGECEDDCSLKWARRHIISIRPDRLRSQRSVVSFKIFLLYNIECMMHSLIAFYLYTSLYVNFQKLSKKNMILAIDLKSYQLCVCTIDSHKNSSAASRSLWSILTNLNWSLQATDKITVGIRKINHTYLCFRTSLL